MQYLLTEEEYEALKKSSALTPEARKILGDVNEYKRDCVNWFEGLVAYNKAHERFSAAEAIQQYTKHTPFPTCPK